MKYIIDDQIFEWDDKKAIGNISKHDITFEQACTVFFDPYFKCVDATDPDEDEARDGVIGYSGENNLLFVVHIEKCDGGVIRIISAREATRQERRIYET